MGVSRGKPQEPDTSRSPADGVSPASQYVTTAAINDVLQAALKSETVEGVAESCLHVAQRLTSSEMGFVGEVNAAGRLDTLAVSETDWDRCRDPESDDPIAIRDMPLRGLFGHVAREGRSLVANQASSHPDSVGTPEGHPRLARFLGVPLKHQGQTTGMIGLANKPSDYTDEDRRRIETLSVSFVMALAHLRSELRVRRMVEQLERRVADRTRDLEDFVYSISHDLRAPLRAVSGFAQIIAQRHRGDLNEQGRRFIDNVVTASGQMDRLIDDLLRYSRLGRGAVRREAVALSEILDDVAETFFQRVEDAGARLEINENLPVVRGDPSLLRQVFTNLVDNALTYHAKGVVPHVVVDALSGGDDIVIRVSDNGIGIEPEYREKVFAMFQRLHSDDEYPGTGIGLAIVKRAVGLLDGDVCVDPVPEGGSQFSVRLPRYQQPA